MPKFMLLLHESPADRRPRRRDDDTVQVQIAIDAVQVNGGRKYNVLRAGECTGTCPPGQNRRRRHRWRLTREVR